MGEGELDAYAILGVHPDAPHRVIRAAYSSKARAAHPDLVGDESLPLMRRLNAAWELLKDPARRAAYDARRNGGVRPRGASTGHPGAGRAHPVRPENVTDPAWTGAAGPPPGRPAGKILDFGVYKGWSLGEVASTDPGYLVWLLERKEAAPYAAELKELIARRAARDAETGPIRPGRKRGWRR